MGIAHRETKAVNAAAVLLFVVVTVLSWKILLLERAGRYAIIVPLLYLCLLGLVVGSLVGLCPLDYYHNILGYPCGSRPGGIMACFPSFLLPDIVLTFGFFYKDLKDLARECGNPTYTDVDRRANFGIVEYDTAEAVESALRKFDGYEFRGNRITIREACLFSYSIPIYMGL